MGITYVQGTVSGPAGDRTLALLVDCGATYSVLPTEVWRSIGLQSIRTVEFTLADGTRITREVSECRFVLPDGTAHSPVVLGEEDDEALLGVVTLENIGLILNPFTRKLQPMRMLLA